MQKKLYVGNLSFNAKEEEVRTLFSACGPVEEVSIITDRQTGRPKGFAFVRMADDEGARKALELNDRDFMGRNLQIAEARSEGPFGAGSGARTSGRGSSEY